jgi:hypothetical protein
MPIHCWVIVSRDILSGHTSLFTVRRIFRTLCLRSECSYFVEQISVGPGGHHPARIARVFLSFSSHLMNRGLTWYPSHRTELQTPHSTQF